MPSNTPPTSNACRQTLLAIPAVLAAAVLLLTGACGAPGSRDGGGSDAPGSIGLLFTDAPSDDWERVDVTVSQIDVLGGDDGPITILDETRTFNLIELEHDSVLVSVTDGVPADDYSKIRMYVDDIVLHPTPSNPDTSVPVRPDIPAGGKLDLNPRVAFSVDSGQLLLIELDMDANSLKIHQAGNGKWKVRPQVFVNILEANLPSRLVRVSGVVEDIDDSDETFRLCDTHAMHHVAAPSNNIGLRCVEVHAEGAEIFDANADPADFTDIDNRDVVTVFGRFDLDGDEELVLYAELIEIAPPGTFLRLRGYVTVAPTAADDVFEVKLDPGQAYAGPALRVQLQTGTVIVSTTGQELDYTDLTEDTRLRTDGLLLQPTSNPDVLKSHLIIVGSGLVPTPL